MKTEKSQNPTVRTQTFTLEQGHSSKLLSLLALATGAAAMPQSGMADIVYRDLDSGGAPVVGYSGALGGIASYMFDDLPGSIQFGFQRSQQTLSTTFGLTYKYRFVTAGRQGGTATATVRGLLPYGDALVMSYGATWSAGTAALFSSVVMGTGAETWHNPESHYNNLYLAWAFSDTSQGGAKLYGWMEVSLYILNYPTGPNVTIHGYAYDNTPDVKPFMGQMPVPEPSSAGLLVLGALALGSRGLRKWRQTRDASHND